MLSPTTACSPAWSSDATAPIAASRRRTRSLRALRARGRGLERGPRRVCVARTRALVLPSRLHVGRGLVDGRDDRPSPIRFLAGVDAQVGEAGVGELHEGNCTRSLISCGPTRRRRPSSLPTRRARRVGRRGCRRAAPIPAALANAPSRGSSPSEACWYTVAGRALFGASPAAAVLVANGATARASSALIGVSASWPSRRRVVVLRGSSTGAGAAAVASPRAPDRLYLFIGWCSLSSSPRSSCSASPCGDPLQRFLFMTGGRWRRRRRAGDRAAAADELERSDRGTSVQSVLDRQVSRGRSDIGTLAGARPAQRRRPAGRHRAGADPRLTSVVRAGPWRRNPPAHSNLDRERGLRRHRSHGGSATSPSSWSRGPWRAADRRNEHSRGRAIDETVWAAVEESSASRWWSWSPIAPRQRITQASAAPGRRISLHQPRSGGRGVVEPPVLVPCRIGPRNRSASPPDPHRSGEIYSRLSTGKQPAG